MLLSPNLKCKTFARRLIGKVWKYRKPPPSLGLFRQCMQVTMVQFKVLCLRGWKYHQLVRAECMKCAIHIARSGQHGGWWWWTNVQSAAPTTVPLGSSWDDRGRWSSALVITLHIAPHQLTPLYISRCTLSPSDAHATNYITHLMLRLLLSILLHLRVMSEPEDAPWPCHYFANCDLPLPSVPGGAALATGLRPLECPPWHHLLRHGLPWDHCNGMRRTDITGESSSPHF